MEEKTLILHIGMHKTGTTSIQAYLYKYLDDPNFEYLKIKGLPEWFPCVNHSGIITTMLLDFRNLRNNVFYKLRGLKELEIANLHKLLIENLINSLAKHSKPNLIISAESLSTVEKDELIFIKNFFSQFFTKTLIYGYVRSPKHCIEGLFSQELKAGFVDFKKLPSLYPKYKNRFQKFDEVYGSENVNLYKYDKSLFPDGDVVKDFCQKIGIANIPQVDVAANPSLSKEAASLLYIYRKYGEEFERSIDGAKENGLFVSKLMQLKGEKLRFSQKLIRPIIEENKEDVEWIEERLGVSIYDIDENGDGIEKEEDLLTVNKDTIEWLAGEVGVKISKVGNNIEGILFLLNKLRADIRSKIYNQDKKTLPNNNKGGMEMPRKRELAEKIVESMKGKIGRDVNLRLVITMIDSLTETLGKEVLESGGTILPNFGTIKIVEKKDESGKISKIMRFVPVKRIKEQIEK